MPGYGSIIIESSFDAIFCTDASFLITQWNAAAERMYGWKAEEVIGKVAGDILKSEVPGAESKEKVMRDLQEKGFFNDEAIQVKKNGERIYVLSAVRQIRNSKGEPQEYIVINRDITAQKKTLQDLQRANDQFYILFNNSAIPKSICSVHDSRVVLVNRSFLNLFGFETAEQVCGKTMRELGIIAEPGIGTRLLQKNEMELQMQKRSGENFYVITFSNTIDYNGEECSVTQFVDITARKNAEREMMIFSNIVSNIPIGIIILQFEKLYDPRSLKLVSINDYMSGVYNVKSKSLNGVYLTEISPETFTSDRPEKYVEISKTRQPCDFGVLYYPPGRLGAEEKYYHVVAFPLPDNMIGVAVEDVTESRKAEEQIKIINNQLQEAQRIAHLGSWEWDVLNNNISWSRELYDIYGLDPQKFESSYENFLLYIHPEDRDLMDFTVRSAMENKESFEMFHRIIRPDGKERVIHGKGNVLVNEDGQVVRMSGTGQDVTIQRKAKEKFKGLLESAPDAVVIVDAEEGKITLVNAQTERMFGYNRTELIGKSVEILIPDRYHVFSRHRLSNTVSDQTGKMGRGLELFGKRKDGSEFPVEISLSPMQTEDGLWVTSAIRDITDRKQAENELMRKTQELMRSNKELEEFAYVASHDLQEPLRNISNYVTLFQRKYYGEFDEETRVYLEFIVQSAGRMKDLIRELLTFSRIGKNRNLARVDCNEIIEFVLLDMKLMITETGARIEVKNELPAIMGSSSEVKQLFQNLISNSVKFRKENVSPVITISCEDNGNEWLFKLEDNGIGIEERFFEKIFNIFQRLHTLDKYPGTGIGLATCKKIVDLNNGRIWVTSLPGEGSAFYFTFPKIEIAN